MNIVDRTISDFTKNARINREAIDRIQAGLNAYNHKVQPDPEAAPLTLTVDDESGQVIGGLLGRSAYGWLRIDTVWVEETDRGQGIGAALMFKAEEIARERSCLGIHLDTHGFQAPAFYVGLGYEEFGELPNYPSEYSHHYFRKLL